MNREHNEEFKTEYYNVKIALAMGWKQQLNVTERFYGEWWDTKGIRRTFKRRLKLSFHSDWNSLMEGVKTYREKYTHILNNLDHTNIVLKRANQLMYAGLVTQDINKAFLGLGRACEYMLNNPEKKSCTIPGSCVDLGSCDECPFYQVKYELEVEL